MDNVTHEPGTTAVTTILRTPKAAAAFKRFCDRVDEAYPDLTEINAQKQQLAQQAVAVEAEAAAFMQAGGSPTDAFVVYCKQKALSLRGRIWLLDDEADTPTFSVRGQSA